ncbi:MAG: dienelactone hydrolase family protein [Acetobacteraceae bacterium]|nr:dienelactone hydrolase family protein [Acetobacteraceae bacterium]
MDGTEGLSRFPLARRGMVMSGLISGFTLAVTPVEAQVIHTDTFGINGGAVKIPVADGDMPAYASKPNGPGPFPIILVNEEIFGVHEHIKDLCRRLAKAGYLAVAPEVYAREGDLSKMTDVQQIVSQVINKTPDAQMLSDLDAAVAWAGQNGGDLSRLGVTGFCRGGRNTWQYDAHSAQVKAAVAWYGPIKGPTSDIQPKTAFDVAAEIHGPLLGLYGGKDTSINVSDVEAAAEKARAAGKIVEIHIYEDAPHGFNADYRPSYRKADAEDGWARMLAWFKKYGVA